MSLAMFQSPLFAQTKLIHVLLIEDNEADAMLLTEILCENRHTRFVVTHAKRLTDGLEKMQICLFDVILLDLSLPDSQGLPTVIKALEWAPNIPIVVMTGMEDDEVAMQAVHHGAQDYFVKGYFDEHMMVRSLYYAIERKQLVAQLREASLHDMLTGLPNRPLLLDRLGRAIERTHRFPDYLFALLFVDLDSFKIINDSLGHLIGDHLLIEIAQRLKACIRSMDTVARLGGDEFCILLDGIKEEDEVIRIADRIHATLSMPCQINDHELYSSASIGITISTTGYTMAEDVLRDADTAMYRAKKKGKSQYVIFDRTMHEKMTQLMQLEIDMRRALAKNEFKVYYQPILSLDDGHLLGVEALVRWLHPQNGLMEPAEFLAFTEESGLIVRLDQWVLQEACKQVRLWQKRFSAYAELRLFVNFSTQQFSVPDLKSQIVYILKQTGLKAAHLNLELKEEMLCKDRHFDQTLKILADIKDTGIHLYLDDFGTGYSSLNCLHSAPIDTLKIDLNIDQHFFDQYPPHANAKTIIRAIVELGHNLEMQVIAEGIETVEQFQQLKALHCEYAQGYLFAKALSAFELESILAAPSLPWAKYFTESP